MYSHAKYTESVGDFEFGLTIAKEQQTFSLEIPEGKHIAKFDEVFFYFLEVNPFCDLKTFDKFTTDSCAVLEVLIII
jgi:hypothetical protein